MKRATALNRTHPPMSAESAAPAGALAGLRVLDLTRVLAGPWCTQTLADLGADVIKVEKPVTGDDTRHWGPPFLRDAQGGASNQAAYFACCNRNKRSLTLDIATPEGQAIVRDLAARSDVLVENFKVGGLEAYGLDHEALLAINPRLIFCSITGFGQTGPYAHRAGYDLMVQAMSGLMSITGQPDGAPGGGPLRTGVAITDIYAGLYATVGILAALQERQTSGRGQHIDISLLDVGMAVLANQGVGYLNSGQVPQRQGNSHPSLAPYQDVPTADGTMLLAIGNDGQFARFCEASGHATLALDPRFSTNTQRVLHREALVERLSAITRERRTADWVALLEHCAVPCGPINDIAQAFDDEHVRARGLALTMRRDADDGIGPIATIASPVRLGARAPTLRYAPPALGQHSDEVLRELGLDEAQLGELRSRGIV